MPCLAVTATLALPPEYGVTMVSTLLRTCQLAPKPRDSADLEGADRNAECEEWPGTDASLSQTLSSVRAEATFWRTQLACQAAERVTLSPFLL